ncbi:MAG: SpoIID/LytB domain-containing protein [Oscillospiraceae bacterium]
MTMAEYLPGVVRGEMPAAFHQQALDAQAVAERTFIYYHMASGRKAVHPDADVCMDYRCCNAYTSAQAAAEKWGGPRRRIRGQGPAGRTGHRRPGDPLQRPAHFSGLPLLLRRGHRQLRGRVGVHPAVSAQRGKPRGGKTPCPITTASRKFRRRSFSRPSWRLTRRPPLPEGRKPGSPAGWKTPPAGWRASASAASPWRAPRSAACTVCGRRASLRRPRRTG